MTLEALRALCPNYIELCGVSTLPADLEIDEATVHKLQEISTLKTVCVNVEDVPRGKIRIRRPERHRRKRDIELFISFYRSSPPNQRLLHLAAYGKNSRVRKKNIKRLMRGD